MSLNLSMGKDERRKGRTAMRAIGKVVGRTLLGLFLTVYVLVALANYSVVQSFVGSWVGDFFSKQWGGTVKIGSLHAMPFDHVIADNILLVSPTNDTIFDAEHLRVSFKKFPFRGDKLAFNRVYLRNAYYHLKIDHDSTTDKNHTNLQYIIDYFKTEKEKLHMKKEVIAIEANALTLRNVHYKMDLVDHRKTIYDHGVQIPHMEFFDINARFRNVRVQKDDVTTRIVSFAVNEKSGFTVEDLSGNVHVSHREIVANDLNLKTPMSHIMLDANLSYDDWKVMGDYLRTVNHIGELKEGTTVALSDVAYWAPVLWGIDAQITARGRFGGTIDNIYTNDLLFTYGNATTIDISGGVKGLPKIEDTRFDVDVLEIRTDQADIDRMLAQFPAIAGSKLMRYIDQLQYVDLQAQAHGGWNATSTVNADLTCGLGNLRADATMTPNERGKHINLEANSDGLGLALLQSEWLTRTGLAVSIEADLPQKIGGIGDIDGSILAELNNSVVRGRRLSTINLHGEMNDGIVELTAASADTALKLSVDCRADFSQERNKYDVDLIVDHINAQAFKLLTPDYPTLSSKIHVRLEGNDIDELTGSVTANKTKIGDIGIDHLELTSACNEGHKSLRLDCDPLTASVDGRFSYKDLQPMALHFCEMVIPRELNRTQGIDSITFAAIADNTMSFNILWHDHDHLLQRLDENLSIAPGTRASGSYNTSELMKLALRSDSLRLGSLMLNNIGISSLPTGGGYSLRVEAQEVNLGQMELAKKANITLNSNNIRSLLSLTWGDEGEPTHGDLLLRLGGNEISVLKPHFTIGETQWTLNADDANLMMDKKMRLMCESLSLESESQRIGARLQLLGQENDCVELDFSHFNTNIVSNLLLQGTNIDVNGLIDGRFTMYGLNATPYFNANLTVDSCVVNRQPLGDVAVRSNWNAELNMLNMQLASDMIDAHGWIGLGKKQPDLNFLVDFDNFQLSLIAPLMTKFSSRFEGRLNGSFDISGSTADPLVIGDAYVENGALKVDLTNVTYYFNDSITFNNKEVRLSDFNIVDPLGNIASVNGKIQYDDLQNVQLDLELNTDNILVLDQKNGDQFYGMVFASANGTITGGADRLAIDVRARTNPGSTLSVPVSNQKRVKSQNYITFVSDAIDDEPTRRVRKRNTGKFDLNLDLSITPDVQLNLPMDFSEVAVKVGAIGSGELHLSLDEQQTPLVLGSYEISNGKMVVSLLSLIDKNFTIESGSNLNFQGSLPDARFDLQAVYSQRVNLSTLTGSLSTIDNKQKYIQVEDIISVSGTMQDPTLKFDLRLPNADQSVEDEVFAYIDRNSERDIMNQTVSLLVFGQFYNVMGNDQGNATAANTASSGLGTVASTLGSMMADMVEFVDINVDYKAANELTREQIDFNISKDWGRWYLESTLGYGGESRDIESSTANGTVLDALIGYRISPLVHLYAYNRTNTNNYTQMDIPYKQGVGIKLTKDFNRWNELFYRKKKKK